MNSAIQRRDFLKTSAVLGIGALMPQSDPLRSSADDRLIGKGLIVSSANGLRAIEQGMALIKKGEDALDAVIASVNVVEDDPNDMTVGLGGLPNYDGVVELDASVMHGPSCRAGGVGALQKIRNPSKVARMIMERTDHVLLVGEGALRFARMHGFKEEDLLTEKSREEWVKWRESLSNEDDYLPPHSIEDEGIGYNIQNVLHTYGTINCLGIDLIGNISGVTTTSGLAYKIPGRVGDSPIIGAGLYVDNDVGAAGSTGRGEANIVNCSSVMVVEYMRQGKSPQEACLMACQRIAEHTKEKRLIKDGKPNFNVTFYALNKRGDIGSAAIWRGAKFAVHDGETARLMNSAYLFERSTK